MSWILSVCSYLFQNVCNCVLVLAAMSQVHETARLVGWRECGAGDDNWDVAWGDTTAALFRGVQQLKPFQRVNHFPSLGPSETLTF